MDYRCSSLVAGLALLIGGSCAFLAPAARAGDRIDFSAPAIPLAIPQPEVESKEFQKAISSTIATDGPADDADMGPQQITVTKSRAREKDPWDINPFRDDDADPRRSDNLFTARSEPNRLTNGISLNMQRGWEDNDSDRILLRRGDSKFETGPNASRFGAQNGLDQQSERQGDRFGRDQRAGDRLEREQADEKNDSLLFKAFSRDLAAPERLEAWGLTTFKGETRNLTGVESDQRSSKFGLPTQPVNGDALPPGYGTYNPSDNRRTDEQPGATPDFARAWEPPPARHVVSRGYSNPDQFNPSRVVAPNRPVNLPMPKLPSNPNPF
jgi:hypothetical protein